LRYDRVRGRRYASFTSTFDIFEIIKKEKMEEGREGAMTSCSEKGYPQSNYHTQ
jgi:hypothetical protein